MPSNDILAKFDEFMCAEHAARIPKIECPECRAEADATDQADESAPASPNHRSMAGEVG